jgi:PncC family amidohydrolase
VPADMLEAVGAVSSDVAVAMAKGVRARLGASIAVATTGIAGPAAAGTAKPIGLTYIAVATGQQAFAREFTFTGDRAGIRRQAAEEALRLLIAEARSVGEAKARSA